MANRVQQIRDVTDPSSWFYVNTEVNPGDHASRGLTAAQLLQGSTWLPGPSSFVKMGHFRQRERRKLK